MQNKTLKSNLGYKVYSIQDNKAICIFLQVSPQLRVLHAHHNEFQEQGGHAIGQVIGNASE